jgi:hypothetical protein
MPIDETVHSSLMIDTGKSRLLFARRLSEIIPKNVFSLFWQSVVCYKWLNNLYVGMDFPCGVVDNM